MKFIAHRGNFKGRNPERENTWSYLKEALVAGYDIETDIRLYNNELWLGHDEPIERAYLSRLMCNENNPGTTQKIWLHCKTLDTYCYLVGKTIHCKNVIGELLSFGRFNCFLHEDEDYTITSFGYKWEHVRLGSKVYKFTHSHKKFSWEPFAIYGDDISVLCKS